MQNPGVPASPAVHLYYHPRLAETQILHHIALGLEEQGVPCRSVPCPDADSALRLGQHAARSSSLRVGLGVAQNGDVVLTHAQYPADRALCHCPPGSTAAQWRNIGANAGQLVKVIPFSESA